LRRLKAVAPNGNGEAGHASCDRKRANTSALHSAVEACSMAPTSIDSHNRSPSAVRRVTAHVLICRSIAFIPNLGRITLP
jgi:hypothetical protein